jgi:hypothetical protein
LRTECGGGYLDLKGRKTDRGENFIMMNFTACILYENIVRVIKSRRMSLTGHVACVGEGIDVYRVLVGRSEGKRPLGRPRREWEDNIKMTLREIGIHGANWIRLAQDRAHWGAFMNLLMNLQFP